MSTRELNLSNSQTSAPAEQPVDEQIEIIKARDFSAEYNRQKAMLLAQGASESTAHTLADSWVDIRARYRFIDQAGTDH